MRSGTIAASAWRIGGAGLRCVWGSERLLPVFLFAALFCSGAEAVTPARLFADEREAAETPPSSRLPIDPGREEALARAFRFLDEQMEDRKSTRLNSSHSQISYAVFCLKKKTITSQSAS